MLLPVTNDTQRWDTCVNLLLLLSYLHQRHRYTITLSLATCGLQDLRFAFLPSCVSQVRIALQMEDGSRLQGSFSCGQSLFEVVTHFSQIGSVCAHVDVTRLNIICRLITAPKQWVGLQFQCAFFVGSARKPVKIAADFGKHFFSLSL